MFCDGSAKQIVQMLLDECGESVDVLCDAFVSTVVKDSDMFAVSAHKAAWHAVGEQIGSYILFVNKTYSETGYVKLTDTNPASEPEVAFNLLSDSRDQERLKQGVRMLAACYAGDAMGGVTSDAFPASWGDKVRQIGAVTARNKIITSIAAKLLDGPAPLRRWLMRTFVMEGVTMRDVLEDEEQM